MINWDQPVEFEDGREVIVQESRNAEFPDRRLCRVTGGAFPGHNLNEKQHSLYWYNDDGTFVNGTPNFYRLRNVDNRASFIPEDWS